MRPDFRQRHYPVLDIIDVHDGDTFRLLIDVGFEGAEFPWLRLRGYSSPELSKRGGPEAQDFAAGLLRTYLSTLWVTTYKMPGYVDMRKTFARYLADVYVDEEGTKFGDLMVVAGHAQVGQSLPRLIAN